MLGDNKIFNEVYVFVRACVRACVRVTQFSYNLQIKNLKLKIARMFLFVVHAPTGDILSGFSDTLYPFFLRHVHVRIAPRLRHVRREVARAFFFLFSLPSQLVPSLAHQLAPVCPKIYP